MKLCKTLLIVAGALMLMTLGSVQARADTVTFSTTGTFTCGSCFGSGSNSVTFTGGLGDALVLTFTGVSGVTVDTSPDGFTFTSFGIIQSNSSGNGATITPGSTLTLNITQTAPSGGSGSMTGTLTGTLDEDTSTGEIAFTVTQVVIGNVTYDVTTNPLSLVPQATNDGVSTVQGRVSTAAVPEPASMLLLGTGLIGVAAAIRRRLKHSAEVEL